MDPEPSGSRYVPPKQRTAIGADSPGQLRILVDLLYPSEQMQIARLFNGSHHEIKFLSRGDFMETALPVAADLVITDDIDHLHAIRRRIGERCSLIVIGTESDAETAYNFGADVVEFRPLQLVELS